MNKLQDINVINNMRLLSLEMIENTDKLHYDIAYASAPLFYILFKNYLKYDLERPFWVNRDRIVLNDSYMSSMYYSTLFFMTNDYSIDDLKNYKKLGSATPSNMELNIERRIETTSGHTASSIGIAVGMAMSSMTLASKYNSKNNTLFDYNVYSICSKENLVEGSSYEAMSLASKYNLTNFKMICNFIDDGTVDKNNIINMYLNLDFDVFEVKNGDNIKEVDKALSMSIKSKKPSLILINGATDGLSSCSNKSILAEIRGELDYKCPYDYDIENTKLLKIELKERLKDEYASWYSEYKTYMTNNSGQTKDELVNYLNEESTPLKLDKMIVTDKLSLDKSLLHTNYQIINVISKFIPNFIGGSLSMCDECYLKGKNTYSKDDYTGKNIIFDQRKEVIGSVMNGMALSGFRPFVYGKLIDVDKMKESIRYSAMMNLGVVYILDGDTFKYNIDGGTGEVVEQLGVLRSIPNLDVYRPCDYKELLGSWNLILENKNPSVIIISNEKLSSFKYTSVSEVSYGGYVISEVKNRLDLIIMASGSEVELAMNLKQELLKNYIEARIVTVPNLNLFLEQDIDYISQVLPKGYKRLAIEFSNDRMWYSLINNTNDFVGVTSFGKSASKDELTSFYELDLSSIIIKIKNNL